MFPKRRIRCLHCGFFQTKHNGHYRGFQHYYCTLCNSYFTDRRFHISTYNKLVWFRERIVGKQNTEQLSERSGYSVRHLKGTFIHFFQPARIAHSTP